MANNDSGDGGKPKVDVADLKARLGLKKKAAAPAPKAAAAREPEVPDEGAIAEARARAKEAMDAAGTSAEAFDVLGQEDTPPPQRLPSAPVVGSEAMVGQGRGRMIALAVGALVALAVGLLMGNLLGQMSGEREQLDAYVNNVEGKLKWFRGYKTASGEAAQVELDAFRDALSTATKDIQAMEAQGGDALKLEGTFNALIPALQRFVEQKAYFPSDRVSADVMVQYADDPMLEAIEYATATEILYRSAQAALGEVTQYARLSRPAGAVTRGLLVEQGVRDMEGGVKLPIAVGAWIVDSGKPQEVSITDPNNPALSQKSWDIMVKKVGAKEAVQVPTRTVMQLDLSPIYDEQKMVVRLLTVDRLAAITKSLNTTSKGLRWDALETKLLEWSLKNK